MRRGPWRCGESVSTVTARSTARLNTIYSYRRTKTSLPATGLGGGMRPAKHRDRWAVGLSIWDAKRIIIFGRIKPLRDERNKKGAKICQRESDTAKWAERKNPSLSLREKQRNKNSRGQICAPATGPASLPARGYMTTRRALRRRPRRLAR